MELRGSNVVITGASSGIGKAVAIEMAKRGARLVLAARRADALEDAAAACRALGADTLAVVTDVTKRGDCTSLIDRAGTVDVLINNAGFAIFDSVAEARSEDMKAMMETNFFGAVHCAQAVLPQMLERSRGSIVNVSSIAGLMGFARMGGYSATKFALAGWTEALRDEVRDRGVEVALVCPATTDTGFFTSADRRKMPAAEKLMPTMSAEKVARAICRSVEDGRYRRILPFTAMLFMRLKEFAPRTAHLLMRRVSRILG